MLLIYMYIIQHIVVLLFLSKNKNIKFIAFLVMITTLLSVLSLKKFTADLFYYAAYSNHPYFEPGFSYLMLFLYKIFGNGKTVVRVIQIIIFVLNIITLKIINRKNSKTKYIIIIQITSVSFYLGINNGLRQYIAFLLITIAIYFTLSKRYSIITTMIIIIISTSIHKSTIFFYFLTLLMIKIYEKLYLKKNSTTRINIKLFYLIIIMLAIAFYVILPFAAKYTTYDNYLNFDKPSRVSTLIKAFIISLIFIYSEYCYGKHNSAGNKIFNYLRFIRSVYFFLFILTALNNNYYELNSRLMFTYFFVESLLISIGITYKNKKKKLTSMIVYISYIFAINVWTIILGKNVF